MSSIPSISARLTRHSSDSKAFDAPVNSSQPKIVWRVDWHPTGARAPSTSVSCLVHFGVNLTANYPSIV